MCTTKCTDWRRDLPTVKLVSPAGEMARRTSRGLGEAATIDAVVSGALASRFLISMSTRPLARSGGRSIFSSRLLGFPSSV